MTSFWGSWIGTCFLWLFLPYFSHSLPWLPILVMGSASMYWSSNHLYLIPLLTFWPSWNPITHHFSAVCLTLAHPFQLGLCHANYAWLWYPYLSFLRLAARSMSTGLPQSHQIDQGSCCHSTFLLLISHSTPETLPHVGCVNSSSFLFSLRTALPMMLNWSTGSELQFPNLPPPVFRAISGSTFFLPGPNLPDACTIHFSAAVCCLREDDFSSFPTLLSAFSCFSVHFLLDYFHVDSDVDSSWWMALTISILHHHSWHPFQLLVPLPHAILAPPPIPNTVTTRLSHLLLCFQLPLASLFLHFSPL